MAGVAHVQPASGQTADREISVYDVRQEDVDGDGRPDITTIDSSFITKRDRVLVYDRAEDMEISRKWEQATDFENDLWVFDAAADGQIELIIDFKRTERGALEAWLWDDQDDDGTVRYQLSPNPTVQESETPNVIVTAQDGWWSRDDKLNFNLDLTVDGQIQASFTSKHWLARVANDGTPDFEIRVRDTDDDGRPDYQWVNAWPEAHAGFGIRRTEIVVNPRDDEEPIHGGIFWPLLGSTMDWDELRLDRAERIPLDSIRIVQERSGYNKHYNQSMPPIQMLWHKGSLLYVGEFVASRFNDETWFTYSITRVRPGETSPVNFEAPFAFYDLAADDDGYPELAIRFEQYLVRDMFPFRGKNLEPLQIVRYNWDQDNDTTWDFKLGLIGRHDITESVTVDDLTLRTIPPSILPQWVTENAWDGATFVADEGEEKWTSEGIYEWDPINHWRDEYVTGLSSERPSIHDLKELVIGQRGEYVFDLHRQPSLYFSPVDRRLHLLGAEGGIWRIDEAREIHYANLGGDYLNQWTLVENGSPRERISFVSDYIIYQNPDGVQFIRTDQAPSLFGALPPRDDEDRRALEKQLQQHQRDVVPWDFEALVAQFGEPRPRARIQDASIQDLRLTKTGFRFDLRLAEAEHRSGIELQPDLQAANVAVTKLGSLPPGGYVVTYDGAFHIARFTEPDVSVRVSLPENLRVGMSSMVRSEVTNDGLGDAKNVVLVVQARRGDTRIDIIRQRIDVLSGEPTRVTSDWKPPTAGAWELQSRIERPDGTIVASGNLHQFDVAQVGANPGRLILLSVGGGWRTIPLLSTLVALITTTSAVLWLTQRSSDNRVLRHRRARRREIIDYLLGLRHESVVVIATCIAFFNEVHKSLKQHRTSRGPIVAFLLLLVGGIWQLAPLVVVLAAIVTSTMGALWIIHSLRGRRTTDHGQGLES